MTPRTKVLAFTHFTNTVGDLFPAKEICAGRARARRADACSTARRRSARSTSTCATSIPTSTPAARTSGRAARASAACSSSTARVHDRIWPSSYSAYPGAVGISRRMEAFGQRDEATMIAFAEALAFQTKVGRTAIEQRSKALAQQLIAGLREDRRVQDLHLARPGAHGRRRHVRARLARHAQAGRRALREATRSASRPAAAPTATACACRRTSTTRREEIDRLLAARLDALSKSARASAALRARTKSQLARSRSRRRSRLTSRAVRRANSRSLPPTAGDLHRGAATVILQRCAVSATCSRDACCDDVVVRTVGYLIPSCSRYVGYLLGS